MNRKGKCSNYTKCLLAYRGDQVNIGEGDEFKCPECNVPLTPFEPETRRMGSWLPLLIGIGLLIVLAWLALGFVKQLNRLTPAEQAAEKGPVTEEPAKTEIPPVAEPETRLALPAGSPPTEALPAQPITPEKSPALTEASVPAAIDLDLANEENLQVKKEVLQRIDLMPTISENDKDKLYVSVERARRMGKVISIPFAKAKSSLGSADIESLKKIIATPQIQTLLQDPTVVFVILGYADKKGDEKLNLKLSDTRAQSAMEVLRDRCGVKNLMHAVAMGGSSLFDDQDRDKNRLVEVWAVLP